MSNLGPIISQRQLDRVLGYIDAGGREGARLLTGGQRLSGDLAGGYFVQPTLFDNVSNDMKIAREEIFGPVISVIAIDTEAERVGSSPHRQLSPDDASEPPIRPRWPLYSIGTAALQSLHSGSLRLASAQNFDLSPVRSRNALGVTPMALWNIAMNADVVLYPSSLAID